MDRTENFRLVNFGQRSLIVLINIIVNILIIAGGMYILRYCFEYKTVLPQVGYFLIWFAAYIYINTYYGVSPGAFIARSKIVDEDGRYISAGHAFFRNFPFLLSLVLHTAMLWHTLTEVSISFVPANWNELLEAYQVHSPLFFQLLLGVQVFIIFDLLSALFNAQNRSLKDLIADSYVIKRSNYYRVAIDRVRMGGNYHHKTAEEKKGQALKELELQVLNTIMEIPEVILEVKRINKLPNTKITAKFIKKPSDDYGSYKILVKENQKELFLFIVDPETLQTRVEVEGAELSLAQWRKKVHSSKEFIKSYLFFLH